MHLQTLKDFNKGNFKREVKSVGIGHVSLWGSSLKILPLVIFKNVVLSRTVFVRNRPALNY